MSYNLVFLGLPADLEGQKDSDARVPIGGAQIAERAVLENLFKFSTADSIVVVPNPLLSRADAAGILASYPEHRRATLAFPEELSTLGLCDATIFQPTTRLGEGAAFRRTWADPSWPLVGLTHALNGPDALHSITLAMACPALFGEADTMVCTSRSAVRVWQQLQRRYDTEPPRGQISRPQIDSHLIPLGVSASAISPEARRAARASLKLPIEANVFLCFGRMSSRSKMDPTGTLLAFRAALDFDRSNLLVFAGDSTDCDLSELRSLVDALQLSGHVIIMENPSRQTKEQLFATSDAFLQLSDNLQETFGLGVLEAMAAGLPVIASDWSGYRDLVVEGETGYLIPTTWTTDPYLNDIAGFLPEWDLGAELAGEVSINMEILIDAIRELASSTSKREALGSAGRRRVAEYFDWSTVVTKYDTLLSGLARSATRSFRHQKTPWPPAASEVFHGYPSAVATLGGHVRYTNNPTIAAAAERFVPEIVGIDGVMSGTSVSIDSLLSSLTVAGIREFEARRIVRRALKYGILEGLGLGTVS